MTVTGTVIVRVTVLYTVFVMGLRALVKGFEVAVLLRGVELGFVVAKLCWVVPAASA